MVKGPYPPQHQGLGGIPTIIPDVPVNAAFLLVFMVCGAAHFILSKVNTNQRPRQFPYNTSAMIFCLTRVLATSLRITWVYRPRNIHISMAAQVFVYAGVIILIVCNLWWAQRILRTQHPSFGWFLVLVPHHVILMIIVVSVLTIMALIASVYVQFYIPSEAGQDTARIIQQYGGTVFATFALLPMPILLASNVVRASPALKEDSVENFCSAPLSKKTLACLAAAILLSTGAVFRATITYLPPVPLTAETPWYYSKACFYIFNFSLESLAVIFWLVVGMDRLFVVPGRAPGPFSYGNTKASADEGGHEKPGLVTPSTLKLKIFMDDGQPEAPSASSRRESRTSWQTRSIGAEGSSWRIWSQGQDTFPQLSAAATSWENFKAGVSNTDRIPTQASPRRVTSWGNVREYITSSNTLYDRNTSLSTVSRPSHQQTRHYSWGGVMTAAPTTPTLGISPREAPQPRQREHFEQSPPRKKHIRPLRYPGRLSLAAKDSNMSLIDRTRYPISPVHSSFRSARPKPGAIMENRSANSSLTSLGAFPRPPTAVSTDTLAEASEGFVRDSDDTERAILRDQEIFSSRSGNEEWVVPLPTMDYNPRTGKWRVAAVPSGSSKSIANASNPNFSWRDPDLKRAASIGSWRGPLLDAYM